MASRWEEPPLQVGVPRGKAGVLGFNAGQWAQCGRANPQERTGLAVVTVITEGPPCRRASAHLRWPVVQAARLWEPQGGIQPGGPGRWIGGGARSAWRGGEATKGREKARTRLSWQRRGDWGRGGSHPLPVTKPGYCSPGRWGRQLSRAPSLPARSGSAELWRMSRWLLMGLGKMGCNFAGVFQAQSY